jgi:hypothetical protein
LEHRLSGLASRPMAKAPLRMDRTHGHPAPRGGGHGRTSGPGLDARRLRGGGGGGRPHRAGTPTPPPPGAHHLLYGDGNRSPPRPEPPSGPGDPLLPALGRALHHPAGDGAPSAGAPRDCGDGALAQSVVLRPAVRGPRGLSQRAHLRPHLLLLPPSPPPPLRRLPLLPLRLPLPAGSPATRRWMWPRPK